jgi:diguanylate cyclase (GGDEF)-like protein/PAS domain S-box-containing protein
VNPAWPENVTSLPGAARPSEPEGTAGPDRAQASVRQAELRMRLLTTRVCMLSWATDGELRVTSCRSGQMSGLQPSPADLVGRPLSETLPGPSGEALEAHRRALQGETVEYEADWLGRSFQARVEPLRDEAGEVVGTVGAAIDVTEVKRAQDELLRSTLRDGLTGLPNRTGFLEVLDRAVGRTGGGYAVLLVNIDGFKGINDVAGYRGGDQVLLEAARRLETILRSGDVLARFAGDEFVILLEDLPDARRDAVCVAERILSVLTDPVDVAGHALSPRASVGIAVGTRGARPDAVLHEAETAMFRAKVQGKARYQIFDGPYDARSMSLLRVEVELRRALEREEFRTHYAPTLAVKGGRVTGFEVLLWRRSGPGQAARR